MKAIFSKAVIFIALFLYLCHIANGQFSFKSGYVITNSGDTILGKIKENGINRNSKICVFKPEHQKKKIKYKPSDIKGFKIPGEKYFISKEFEKDDQISYQFIEVIIDGGISLYSDWKDKLTSYYIQKKDSDLIGLTYYVSKVVDDYSEHVGYKKEQYYEYMGYKAALLDLFKDSKPTTEKIEMLNYRLESIANLTKKYLKEKGESSSISFERNIEVYKPQIGFLAGVRFNQLSYSFTYDKADVNFQSYPFGIYFVFPLSRLSNNLSIKVELAANMIKQQFGENYSDNSISIGIPTLLKYRFLSSRFSPTIAGGYGFSMIFNKERTSVTNPLQQGGIVGEIGFDYQISRKLTFETAFQLRHNLNNDTSFKLGNYPNMKVDIDSGYSTLLVGIRF